MNLPDADNIKVERAKIVSYLLNPEHPDNLGKASFFLGLGFNRENWELLAAALLKAAANQAVTKSVASPHGTKYVVDVRIETPGGKAPMVRTIWIVDLGLDTSRLVTAYPREE